MRSSGSDARLDSDFERLPPITKGPAANIERFVQRDGGAPHSEPTSSGGAPGGTMSDASEDFGEKLSRLRTATAELKQRDARIRDDVLGLSQALAEQCRRASVWFHAKPFVLDQVGDESTYGYLGVSADGIFLAGSSPAMSSETNTGIPVGRVAPRAFKYSVTCP